METYKVAPFDQNLWVHGKYLTDPTQTLGQLRILPKSLIYLRADEPNLPGTNSDQNVGDEDTSWVVPQNDPQEGFKGNWYYFVIGIYDCHPWTLSINFFSMRRICNLSIYSLSFRYRIDV
jgi:hypothetical protein